MVQKIINEEFFSNVLAGTGKTFTSLFIVEKLSKEIKNLLIIIAAPKRVICDMWVDTIKIFNFNDVRISDTIGKKQKNMFG